MKARQELMISVEGKFYNINFECWCSESILHGVSIILCPLLVCYTLKLFFAFRHDGLCFFWFVFCILYVVYKSLLGIILCLVLRGFVFIIIVVEHWFDQPELRREFWTRQPRLLTTMVNYAFRKSNHFNDAPFESQLSIIEIPFLTDRNPSLVRWKNELVQL